MFLSPWYIILVTCLVLIKMIFYIMRQEMTVDHQVVGLLTYREMIMLKKFGISLKVKDYLTNKLPVL